jgi:hypothetical protein
MTKTTTLTSTLLLLVLAPGLAAAQGDPGFGTAPAPMDPAGPTTQIPGEGTFGTANQIFITEDFNLNYTHTSMDPGGSRDALTFTPTLGYFLSNNFAIGGTVGLSWVKDVGTTFSIGPMAGYNIPLSGPLSIFPMVSLTYENISLDNGPSGYRIPLAINAPVLFHLMPHLSLGLGPFFAIDIAAKDNTPKQTSVGIDFTFLGYF